MKLVGMTYSGATAANILRDRQHGAPPRVDALDGSERLVTVTIGGNDAGYVPLLFAATLRRRCGCCRCSAARFATCSTPPLATVRWTRSPDPNAAGMRAVADLIVAHLGAQEP